jgi:hypothetical protein
VKGRPTTVKGTTSQHKTNVTAAPGTGIKPPKTKRRKNRRDTVRKIMTTIFKKEILNKF